MNLRKEQKMKSDQLVKSTRRHFFLVNLIHSERRDSWKPKHYTNNIKSLTFSWVFAHGLITNNRCGVLFLISCYPLVLLSRPLIRSEGLSFRPFLWANSFGSSARVYGSESLHRRCKGARKRLNWIKTVKMAWKSNPSKGAFKVAHFTF